MLLSEQLSSVLEAKGPKPKMVSAPEKALSAFMTEFFAATHPNPIDSTERVVGFRRPGVKIPKDAKVAPPGSVDWVIVKVRPFSGHIHIEWMQVIPGSEKRGAATKTLEILTELADKYHVQMGLNAKPVGEPKIPKGKLKALYQKFGFVTEYGDHMIRDPKGGVAKEDLDLVFEAVLEEGVAAYNRGSRVVTRNILRDRGIRDPSDYPSPEPKPRPEGWGGKAADRAEKWATNYLKYAKSRGHEVTVADLAYGISQYTKVGRKTAQAVATKLLGEAVG